jgi:hypothetical protein
MAKETTTPGASAATGGQLRLANADPRYQQAYLIDPSPARFVHIAVQPGAKRGPGPVRGSDEYRDDAVAVLAAGAADVAEIEAVREAALFRAVLLSPPPSRGGADPVQPDVALLIETTTTKDAVAVGSSPRLEELLRRLHGWVRVTSRVSGRPRRRSYCGMSGRLKGTGPTSSGGSLGCGCRGTWGRSSPCAWSGSG